MFLSVYSFVEEFEVCYLFSKSNIRSTNENQENELNCFTLEMHHVCTSACRLGLGMRTLCEHEGPNRQARWPIVPLSVAASFERDRISCDLHLSLRGPLLLLNRQSKGFV